MSYMQPQPNTTIIIISIVIIHHHSGESTRGGSSSKLHTGVHGRGSCTAHTRQTTRHRHHPFVVAQERGWGHHGRARPSTATNCPPAWCHEGRVLEEHGAPLYAVQYSSLPPYLPSSLPRALNTHPNHSSLRRQVERRATPPSMPSSL